MRHRAPALLLFGLLVVLLPWAAAAGAPTADASLFAAAGQRLLSGDGTRVFDDPSLQVGPLYLLVVGAGAHLGRPLGLAPEAGGSLLAAWSVVAALLVVVRQTCPRSPTAAWGVFVQVLLGGGLAVGLVAGHLEDLLAVLLVAAAGASLHRRRPAVAGLLLAAAVCTKLWALLALVALLCLPDVRAGLRALSVAGGVVTSAYLPFVSTARTSELVWQVAEPSVVALVLPAGTPVSAPGRALQLAAGAVLVALVLRGSTWDRRAAWTVPAAVVWARIGTDPHVLPYYWCAAAVPAALSVWSGRRAVGEAVAAGLACALGLLVLTSVGGRPGSLLVASVLVVGGLGLHRAARRPQEPAVERVAAGSGGVRADLH